MRDAALHLQTEALVEQVLALIKQGKVAPAGEVLRLALHRNPTQFDALFLMGVVSHFIGHPQDGEKLVEEALRLNPEAAHYDYFDNLLRQQGSYSRANSLFTLYLEYRKSRGIDAFLLSYPKCGRTWLRALLGRALTQHFGLPEQKMLELLELTRHLPNLPTLEFSHDDYPHWKPPEGIVEDKSVYKEKKVLFLARDPRDVMVSSYFEYTRRRGKQIANDQNFAGGLSEFLRHPIGGIANVIGFYNVWARQRDVPKAFLLVTYENLHADPVPNLRRMMNFLGYGIVPDVVLEDAVAYCTFEKMKKMEQQNAFNSMRLQASDPNDPESFKVRKGKVGGYNEYLSPSDIAWLNAAITTGLDDYFVMYKTEN